MDWQCWIEEGRVRPKPGAKEHAMPTIALAWDSVGEARAAYLDSEWELADEHLRKAFCTATEALVCHYDLELARKCDFEMAERLGSEYFGERVARPIFDKARILRSMMPLDKCIPEREGKEVRRSVAASSQYVALVECFIYP